MSKKKGFIFVKISFSYNIVFLINQTVKGAP